MDHKLCVNLNWAKLIGFSVLVIISIVHSVEVRPVSNEIKYICKCVSEEKPPFLCLLPPLGSSGSGTSAASYGGSCWGRQVSCPCGDCWCKRDCITHVCDGYCCFCKGLIDASGSTFIWMLVWQQPESKQVTTPNITSLLMPRRLVEALSSFCEKQVRHGSYLYFSSRDLSNFRAPAEVPITLSHSLSDRRSCTQSLLLPQPSQSKLEIQQRSP